MSTGNCRTFSFRLYPTTRQQAALRQLLANQCDLYYAALDARRGAWRWEKRGVSYFDDCLELTELRAVRPDVFACGVTVCRGTLKRLDRAFAGFYRRCSRGEKPGYPRFRVKSRFDSVQWEDHSGWKIDERAGRLQLFGIGAVKLHLHRPIRGVPKAITVKREGRHWAVSVRCVEVPRNPLPKTGREVGIDLGVVALVATSDGALVEAGRYLHRDQDRLKAAEKVVSKRHRSSKRRQRAGQALGAIHRKGARKRKDLLHKASRLLVDNYDVIVREKLKPSQMSKRPKPRPNEKGDFEKNGAAKKSGLNRSIQDAGWGMLCSMIAYKVEDAGRQVVVVDPRNTSRRCSKCGHTEKDNRRGPRFSCLACGHESHADLNAAVNILRAGRAQQRPLAA